MRDRPPPGPVSLFLGKLTEGVIFVKVTDILLVFENTKIKKRKSKMAQAATLPITYCTTNDSKKIFSFREALLMGQAPAPDNGLFVPIRVPHISRQEMLAFVPLIKKQPYWKIAYEVLRPWFTEQEISDADLKALLKKAYTFEPTLEEIQRFTYIMRLDTGPTFSFKDYAMRLLALLFRYFGFKITIITATSGDTGSAFTDGFRTGDGSNILALAVEATFDVCQNLARRVFADPDLAYLHLSSANSINIGRILAQIVYYFYAYAWVVDEICKLTLAIPSGNFGDMMGAVFAKEMGLWIHKIIVATNANNEFPLFWRTGIYNPIDPSINCDSNAMNVGNPSNLRRVFQRYGGHLSNDGVILEMPDMDALHRDIFATSVCDEATWDAIDRMNYFSKGSCIIEPHGAVALVGLERYMSLVRIYGENINIILETAHPAKFADTMKSKGGIEVPLPNKLQELLGRSEKYDVLSKKSPDDMYESLKEYIKKHFDTPQGIQGLVLFPRYEVSELQRRQMTVY